MIAYGISGFLVQGIFINYSPTVRKNTVEYLAYTLGKTFAPIKSLFPSGKTESVAKAKDVDFLQKVTSQIAPGVRAADEVGISYVEYDLDKVEWEVIKVKLSNGKTVTFRQPKGSPKRPQVYYERYKDDPTMTE